MLKRALLLLFLLACPLLAVASPIAFSFYDDPSDALLYGRPRISGTLTGILYGLPDNGVGVPTSFQLTSDVSALGMTQTSFSISTDAYLDGGWGFNVVGGNIVGADVLLDLIDPTAGNMELRFNGCSCQYPSFYQSLNSLAWNGGSGPLLSMGNQDGFQGATYTPITAVPEPDTYGMLLAGLGLLGFFARRRARTQAA
jgi:PEP-CTERM motif-containing protein